MRSRPWTAQDAVAHNADLKGKPELQKLWADTANGTLAGYLKRKTPQAKAEGMAIATANKTGNRVASKKRRMRDAYKKG